MSSASADPYKNVKDACAIVEADRVRSTGFLVTPDLVVTPRYVVFRDFEARDVRVRFGDDVFSATVAEADHRLAFLRINRSASPAVPPLPLGDRCSTDDRCLIYGFPPETRGQGLLIQGEILDPFGLSPTGEPAIVARFPPGVPISGGSPLMVKHYVVGMVHRALFDEAGRPAGVYYASPVPAISGSVAARLDRPRVPSLHSVHRLLNALIIGADDLNSFLILHVSQVWKKCNDGMNSTAKINLLFQYCGPAEIVAKLRKQFGDEVAKHERLLEYEEAS